MHKGILAGRMLEARRLILAAVATAVTDPALLDALRAAQAEKRTEVRDLYEMEALVPIVEHLATQAKTARAEARTAVAAARANALTAAEILAIPGLTKTSREAIETYFADLETAETEDA